MKLNLGTVLANVPYYMNARRPREPAQGGSCGILTSSCGIKIRIWGRQNFYMTPITMGLLAVRASNPTWHKCYWRPCELVWDGQCGILIGSCGIKVGISQKYKLHDIPSQWCKQAITRDTNAVGDHIELVWGDECGILISPCRIKVNTSRKYKSCMTSVIVNSPTVQASNPTRH